MNDAKTSLSQINCHYEAKKKSLLWCVCVLVEISILKKLYTMNEDIFFINLRIFSNILHILLVNT
jgi:ABC-type uncharacterized transport system ATPase subunit